MFPFYVIHLKFQPQPLHNQSSDQYTCDRQTGNISDFNMSMFKLEIRDCLECSEEGFKMWYINNHHHHLSLNREGCWGTTDDLTTSFLHFSLFSTALLDLVFWIAVKLLFRQHSAFWIPVEVLLMQHFLMGTCILQIWKIHKKVTCEKSSMFIQTLPEISVLIGWGGLSGWRERERETERETEREGNPFVALTNLSVEDPRSFPLAPIHHQG